MEIDVGIFRNRVAELLVTCSFDGNAEELQAWRGKVVRALDLRYGTRDIGRSLMTHGPVWRTDESLEVALQDLPVDAAVPVPGLQVKPQRVVIRYSDVYAVGQRTGEAIEKDAREIVEASKKL